SYPHPFPLAATPPVEIGTVSAHFGHPPVRISALGSQRGGGWARLKYRRCSTGPPLDSAPNERPDEHRRRPLRARPDRDELLPRPLVPHCRGGRRHRPERR